jgi:hypothetical protein
MKNQNKSQEHFFYLRQEDGHPIGVLAMRKASAGSILFAGSLCSPNDEWNRTAGINKATGKLNSPDHQLRMDIPNGGKDARPNLAENLISGLFQPKHRTPRSADYVSSVRKIDMARAQATLVKQIQHMLTPKPAEEKAG